MRTFRTLTADEIECRIAEVGKKGNYVSLLLYKTARTDSALLDETFGAMDWQCDYKVIDGKMYCGIGIYDSGKDTWVWKWNCGTESNMEAEKGQASDALKRAGFAWGIGAELYTSPRITVFSSKCSIDTSGQKLKCNDRFIVKEIAYDEKENISKLVIYNDTQKCNAFEWAAGKPEPKPEPKPEITTAFECADCGSTILPYIGKDGKEVSIAKHVARTNELYGVNLCINCVRKRQKNES